MKIGSLHRWKVIKVVALILVCSFQLIGQQQVLFTQYMFNMLPLNPAYSGIHEGISMNFLTREQWVGLEGAPSTQTFSIHSPIKYRPIAIGGTVIRDVIGPTTQYGIQANYAYRMKIGDRTKLSLGMQGTMHIYQSNAASDANINDQTLTDFSETSPNIGLGTMFYSDRYYIGFSMPQLLNYTVGNEMTTDVDSEIVRHYFFTAGYVFEVNPDLKLKPNFMVRGVENAPVQFDVNINAIMKDIVWLGLSYRSMDSFDALFQIQVSPKLQVGYAYDFATTTDMRRVNAGSHELMVSYLIHLNPSKVVTPRYF